MTATTKTNAVEGRLRPEFRLEIGPGDRRGGGRMAMPSDFSASLGRRQLIGLCLDAVQQVDPAELSKARKGTPGNRPEMFITLLAYAYSAGIYDSHDVADAVYTDSALRYIAAGARPDGRTLRRFRRQHRNLLQSALAHVFRAGCRRLNPAAHRPRPNQPAPEPALTRAFSEAALNRLNIAAWMDGSDAN